MRILKTIGIIGATATVLLSGTVVFAREQATSTPRENAKAVMETRRAQMQASTTMMRQKAAERVAEIRDKVKQQKAEKLARQFENLNKTWTDHFMNLLDRYTAILQKMQARADIAAAAGKNVTAANTAIQLAKTAIETAQTAIIAQAAKTYAPVVSSTGSTSSPQATQATAGDDKEIEKELRSSFKNLHSTLFKDLFALRDGAMKNTRTAVQAALQTLGKVKGVDDDTATTTRSTDD